MRRSGQRRFSRHAAPSTVRGRVGLRQPLVDRAVAAHLARRQIAQADAEAERGVTRDDAAQADFDVVGMRPEDQQINGHSA